MIVGFTGTSSPPGMTNWQKKGLMAIMLLRKPTEFRHGDCIESDEQAHDLTRKWFPTVRIVVHPPLVLAKRACCQGDVILPAKEYLPRNHDIVDACDVLVAAPKEHEEQLRYGTWATVRYARKIGREVVVIEPGSLLHSRQ